MHADIEDHILAKYVMSSNPNQKEFYFLDIGAGDFQWNDFFAKQINCFPDIADDVKVNIIGVRGENYDGVKFSAVGKCNIFKLGQFKIENLEEAFQTINLDLTGKIDCIYTSWCFRHLVDPMGTLKQAYNLLKPKTGLFFGDGFFYSVNGQSAKDLLKNKVSALDNITKLLLDMKVQFLIEPTDTMRVINRFVFKRNTDDTLHLPLKYTGMISLGDTCDVHSQVATTFDHIGPEPAWIGARPYPNLMYNKLCGDLDLFNFFKDNKLFYSGEKEYSSLINQ
jgi:SAM-dependent methyltransferase